VARPIDWTRVTFSWKASMPIETVAMRETIDQMTPVAESWFFSKIAGIQAAALIISNAIKRINNVQPGLRANFLDTNSPIPKKIAEISIHAHAGRNKKIFIGILYHDFLEIF
jgi:hypothetical protein